MLRLVTRPGGIAALAALLTLALPAPPARAVPTVQCETELLQGGNGADLGGRYMYHVSAVATEPYTLVSELLVLDREGGIIQEIPVFEGDIFQFLIRDQVKIERKISPPRDWLIQAPGVLFRAKVTEGFLTSFAYTSPFAAIRVDQPEDLVFTATTASPQADVRLLVGVGEIEPSSIRILVDCVDILAATGASFPGGPFGGVAMIAGTPVTIQDMVGDLDQGTIAFTLLDLPGGSHLVRVEGTPNYLDDLPPGHPNWNRPLGQLEHEATLSVFRVEITDPAQGAELALAPTTIQGVITHGLPPSTLRMHGMSVPLPPATFIPGDGCVGDVYRVEFTAQIPVADVARDLAAGDDQLTALDPGVNFVTALATDEGGHVANGRVRFSLGAVQSAVATMPRDRVSPQDAASNGDCEPTTEIPGFVRNGFAVSLSELAMSEAIKAKLLPDLSTSLTASLNSLIGTTVEAQLDPCPDSFLRPGVVATVRFEGQAYGVTEFAELLRTRYPRHAHAGAQLRPATAHRPERHALTPADAPDLDPIGDQTVDVNQTLVVTLVANDPDGDAITYSLTSGPPNSRVVENRFEFHPSCDELGAHAVTVAATADGETDSESFTVTVNEPEAPETYNATFEGVSFDPSTMNVRTEFTGSDEVQIIFDSGSMVFHMSAGDCYGDCLFDCCVSWSVDFDIIMSNVQIVAVLNANQLLCGVSDPSEIPDPGVDIQGLEVDFGDPHIGGVFGWLTGAALLGELLNVFGIPQALLDAFASDYIVSQIHQPLEDALVNQFPGVEFSGLHEMGFSVALPGVVPVSLETRFSDLPRIDTDQAISMGIHSAFAALTPEDPAPPWFPTFSEVPNVGVLGGDFAIGTSDDGLNQLMSSLVAAGEMRARFAGHTIGEFVPGLSIPELGITSETPILLTVDAAQDAVGNAIPPIVGFIDDPATPSVFEAKVRVQLTVRGILERGQPVLDDRSVCSCTSLSPSCVGQPCLIYETVLKLNFITHVSLNELIPGFLAVLNLEVAEIQQLTRGEGFDSFEASDFTDDEGDIVATSADSPVLALLRDEINEALPMLPIPPEALTLDGWVVPANLRLFMATVDAAGLGTQDYFGLLADVVPAAAKTAAPIALRSPVVREPAWGNGRSALAPGDRAAAQQAAGEAEARAGFALAQNFPNPFRGSTTLRAMSPRATTYRFTIFNAAGAVVRKYEGIGGPGRIDVRWDGADDTGRVQASGMYVCRFEAEGVSMSRKLLFMK